MAERHAFITGSHAYGIIHEDSDIDLVVCMDDDVRRWLVAVIEDSADAIDGDGYVVRQFRVGKLNLIMLEAGEFDAWHEANNALVAESVDAPVTRERACEVIGAALKEVNRG